MDPTSSSQQHEKRKATECLYVMGKTLGEGSFATVKECTHIESGMVFAVKIINERRMKGDYRVIRSEMGAMRSLRESPSNLLKLIDHFHTDKEIYMVTDLAKGGDLFDSYRKYGACFPEARTSKVIFQVLEAIATMHDNGIIHRDVKLENILLKTDHIDSDVVLADFGLSVILRERKRELNMPTGTKGYIAPEMLYGKGYDAGVDIWAVGITTYLLLQGKFPWNPAHNVAMDSKTNYKSFRFSSKAPVSAIAECFVRDCLQVDSMKRCTAKEALKHEFFTGQSLSDSLDQYTYRKSCAEIKKMDGRYSSIPQSHATEEPTQAVGLIGGEMNRVESELSPHPGQIPLPKSTSLELVEATQTGATEGEGKATASSVALVTDGVKKFQL